MNDCLRIRTALACGGAILMTLTALPASSEETTWEITGTFAGVTDPATELPSDFVVGTEYRMVIRFDNQVTPTNAQPAFCDASGCRIPQANETATGFRYNIAQPGMQFDLYAGTSCQPCTFTSPTGGNLIVRDNFPVFLGVGTKPTDGISLGLTDPDDAVDIGLLLRTENLGLNLVTGPQVSYLTPAGAADVELSAIQIQDSSFTGFRVTGETRTVSNPTYGVGYVFTARDCRIPARTDTFNSGGQQVPVDPRPYDCANFGANRGNAWSVPAGISMGGALGLDGLSETFTPSTADIDDSWGDGGTQHATAAASLGLSPVPMGSLFGDVTFGGPAGFPVLKGITVPGDSARLNTNLVAFQRYNYSGGVTQLPLVLGLTYAISDNSNDPDVSPFLGDRPGGAGLGATMSIVDGSAGVRLEAIRRAVSLDIRGIACGNEAALGLPPNSILGTALVDSAAGQNGSYAVTQPIQSCANPGQPVQLQPNQGFVVVTGMQLPSRGQAPQPPRTIAAPANGWIDSANTLRVKFDPEAPPALVQALVAAIEPACADCEITPDERIVGVDIKPGSADNCINPQSNGVIPVAILGSGDLAASEVRIDETLAFGSLGLRIRGKSPGCTVTSVNGDVYPDLLCHFQNESSGWHSGQSSAAVTGTLNDGVTFTGSDSICLVQ